MIIKSIKINLLKRIFFFLFIILLASCILFFCIYNGFNFLSNSTKNNSIDNIINSNTIGENFINQISNISAEELAEDSSSSNSYIKWVDFQGTASLLKKLADLDISSHSNGESIQLNWIELMAYLRL